VKIPSVVKLIHYVLDAGPNQGQCRPAIVIRSWGDNPDSLINIQVFVDGSNDYFVHQEEKPLVIWRTSVHHDESSKVSGTWHWPEYIPDTTDSEIKE
jgi:hypothetical protein